MNDRPQPNQAFMSALVTEHFAAAAFFASASKTAGRRWPPQGCALGDCGGIGMGSRRWP